ncbi:hypothetical protein SNE40_013389 [Patella caerulea]|uniref:acylglycerol lipase n=1 Tax=Patella caerulea TaxID=87958 RepID=A0AAN8JI60_PATCE
MWQYIIYSSSAVLVSMVTGAVALFFISPKHVIYWLMRLDAKRSGMNVKYIKNKDFTYCYAERGVKQKDKLTILAVHGFTGSKEQYLQFFKKLPSDVHLIAVDLPGHGLTSTPGEGDKLGIEYLVQHVHKFVKLMKLDKEPFHLVGASLGGAIVGLYTAEYPETVASLSLICPAMKTPQHSLFTRTIEECILNGIEKTEMKDCPLIPETSAAAQNMLDICLYNKKNINTQILQGLVDLRKPKNPFFLQLFKALASEHSTTLLEEKARKITVPTQIVWGKHDEVGHTQIVWGKHDEIIDMSGVDVLKELLPNCQQVDIIEKCGHSITLDRPGSLVKAILTFRGEYQKKS